MGIVVPLVVAALLGLLAIFLVGALLAWRVRKKRAEEAARKKAMRESADKAEKEIAFVMDDSTESKMGTQDTLQKLVGERDRLQKINTELANKAGDTPMVIVIAGTDSPDDIIAQIQSLKTDNDRLRETQNRAPTNKKRRKNRQQTAFGQVKS